MISPAMVTVEPPELQPKVSRMRATPPVRLRLLKPEAPEFRNCKPLCSMMVGPWNIAFNAPPATAGVSTRRHTGVVYGSTAVANRAWSKKYTFTAPLLQTHGCCPGMATSITSRLGLVSVETTKSAEARLVGDFEGIVTFGIGLRASRKLPQSTTRSVTGIVPCPLSSWPDAESSRTCRKALPRRLTGSPEASAKTCGTYRTW